MKYALLGTVLAVGSIVLALDGDIGIHDPSTVTLCDGKYYTYGTGGNPLVSDDGWTWRRGVTPARTGAAPDVIHIGDRYYMYISDSASPTDIIEQEPRSGIPPTTNGKTAAIVAAYATAWRTSTPSIRGLP